MSDRTKTQGPALALAAFTRIADPVRHKLLPLDSARVIRLAERLNGLHDFGGGGMRARLDETMDSVLQVDWNALGRFGLRYIFNWHLGNRLRLVELFKQHPDILGVPIDKPIFITGLFRTGTTYLHNVLAADPANRAARTWELTHPVGRRRDLLGDSRWRRWRGRQEVAMDDFMVPDQEQAHKVTVEGWEEDFFLLENDMTIMKLFVGLGDYQYGMRMLDWDMVEPYEWHKKQLQLLWTHRSAERWLLKCPWHLWNLNALLSVYPDACVIQTHRSLADTIGSQCSLSARIASKFQRALDLHEVGRFWLEYSRLGVERGLEARTAFPSARIFDVRTDDLHVRPLEVVRDIYRYFDLPLDDELASRLNDRISEEPVTQLGTHDYDIADYGLTADQIEDVFAGYRERFEL